jgi:hypothetical protein
MTSQDRWPGADSRYSTSLVEFYKSRHTLYDDCIYRQTNTTSVKLLASALPKASGTAELFIFLWQLKDTGNI